MVEEDFILNMRETTSRGIWKSPGWKWPTEQTALWKEKRGGVSKRRREERRSKRRPKGQREPSEDQKTRDHVAKMAEVK